VPAGIIFLLPARWMVVRSVVNLTGAVLKVSLAAYALWLSESGGAPLAAVLTLAPRFDLVLRLDALGLLFLALSSVLWLVTTLYAIGYVEGARESRRFFGFFSLCITATAGIAMAGNLLTFFVFYELLTIVTSPLVVHYGDAKALRAGAVYLTYSLGASTLMLGGMAWLYALNGGPIGFAAEGDALAALAAEHRTAITVIFALLVAGMASKAAMVPLHAWLPLAMVAPAPASALRHAVAVVKAGAFGIVRVLHDLYGPLAHDLGVAPVVAAVAGVTILYGSLQALRQDDLKKRLAFSTVGQISYIVLGAAVGGPIALLGALAHLVNQGVMKITLFFCAGGIAETLHLHKISELDGIGRRMPLTMGAFTVAALGMIGLPPMAGFVTKWYLGTGALEAGQAWVVGVLVASALLNAAYFLPILHAAWLKPLPAAAPRERHEAPPLLLVPPLVTATLTVLFGLVPWDAGPLVIVRTIIERQEFP